MKNLPKIFIVEDDVFYANLLKKEITKNRLGNVETYHTGEDFIDNLYKNPDVVLLDHNLGNMNGVDVLKKIKSISPKIQVIFLSAQEKMHVAITSLKFGAFDYVEKNNTALNRVKALIRRIGKFNQIAEEKKQFNIVKIGLFVILTSIISISIYLQLFHSSIFF
ncbi:MAG: response regulator [Flavobacteriales bacterium]|nr:response regulator [Flavobacteriales bacterium]